MDGTARVFLPTAATAQRVTFAIPEAQTLPQVFPWLATANAPQPSLGEEFAAYAEDAREWAELTMPSALEGWPDDDWSEE